MPLTYASGDPFLSPAQTLAFGYNARARSETTPFMMEMQRRYPAAFASYRKQCNQNRLKTGDLWIWRESVPRLAFMVVRETSVGATRPRYIDRVALRIARDYQLEGITSLAIAGLGRDHENPSIREALELMLAGSTLPVVVYEDYIPGVAVE